jgi:PHD/YefM family antitoxin component YafN of YafNO toxin-antitoxin module
MTLATQILKAPHVGTKDLRTHLARNIKSEKPIIITEHGRPKKVMLPYDMMVDLIETLEELQDKGLMKVISEGKEAVARGAEGVPVERSFRKVRAGRKS